MTNACPLNFAKGHPSFLLHSVTRLHRLGFQHYYGFICHLTLTITLSRLLAIAPEKKASRFSARLPRLLRRLPVRYAVLKHFSRLTEYWASCYFAHLPLVSCRIWFAYATYILLSMASFRPYRWPVTPLPFELPSPQSGWRGLLSGHWVCRLCRDRVGRGVTAPDLSHHRTYGSVYGGSKRSR